MRTSCSFFKQVVLVAALAATTPIARGQGRQDGIPPRIGPYTLSRSLGDSDEFGRVSSVAVSASGDLVAVLDAYNFRVAVFFGNSTVPVHFGRRGRGPGEFFHPIDIAVRRGEVLVLDGGNLQVVRIGASEGELTLRGTIPVPFGSPAGTCTIDNRLFVLGLHAGSLIHELDDTGAILQSFGTTLPDDPVRGELSATGRLACDAGSGRVAHAVSTLNHVAVYSAEGSILSEGRIPGYVRQEYDTSGGLMRPLRPEGGFIHRIEALQWLPNGTLLVQMAESRRQPAPTREARVLDVESGWLATSPAWPRVLAIVDQRALFYEEAPFPTLKVYDESQRR